MSNKGSNGGLVSKITYAIIIVFVALLLLAVVGFFARFTNNFTTGFATFYIEYDGKTITADKGGYAFDLGEEYRIDVGYSLDFVNEEKLTYNVKVVPNITEETDFVIETGNDRYKFSDMGDLTEFFKIDCYDGYFTITAEKPLNGIIKAVYGDTAVGTPVVDGSIDYLTLVVSSEDGGKVINLGFNATIQPTFIQPNYGNIVAG